MRLAALGLLIGLLVFTFAVVSAGSDAAEPALWRSSLYPEDWTPQYTDAQGRFLHDFSYAGYHMGEKPLPTEVPGLRVDVTKPPYNADNTGKESATAAIQRAINDVGLAGGGTVFLPAGTYRLTFRSSAMPAALIIAHSHVVLQGEGTDKTFLFLDETFTRERSMIQVSPITSSFSWRRPADGVVQRLRADVDARERVIPLDGPPQFAVGEWVVIQYDLTPEWIAEHNMSDGWDSSIAGPSFFRQVVAVDLEQNTITIDTPVRYPVKVRDNGRVYRAGEPLREVGLADFSVGMREHPATTGWGNNDHGRAGTGAYDVHASRAVSFNGVINSWIRDVATYKPPGNSYAHIHSIGFAFSQSRFLTIRRVSVENPQYRGGGGNGYPFVVGSQDSLYDNLRAINGRHNFTISGQAANGNVIYRGYIANPIESLAADFHAYLSMANLIDNLTIDQDRFDAADRSGAAGVSGFPKHGVSTTQSVFWNVIGLAYRRDLPAIIRTDQYGWGYVIGTRGPAARVQAVDGNPRTLPQDFVEGEGRGDTLVPQSLYLDQLERRLRREGKEHLWEAVRAELTPLPEVPASAQEAAAATRLAPLELPLLVEEDFESAPEGALPEGWEVIESANSPDLPAVIQAPAELGNGRILHLGRTAGTSLVTGHAAITFPPAAERLRVEFDFYATSTRRSLRITLGGSSHPPAAVHRTTANAAIFLAMNGGVIRSLLDAAANQWAYGGDYSAGRWHRVLLDIDVAAKSFNVYIDGSPVAANATPIPFHMSGYDDLSTIAFSYQSLSTHDNTDPVYVDNVTIWGK